MGTIAPPHATATQAVDCGYLLSVTCMYVYYCRIYFNAVRGEEEEEEEEEEEGLSTVHKE